MLENAIGRHGIRGVGCTMDEKTNNPVLEHLRHIRGSVDDIREDMREVKSRLGLLEQQYAIISGRLDRLTDRVERIERRLDLVEHSP